MDETLEILEGRRWAEAGLFAVHNARWVASPEGIAIYRKGHPDRTVPWEEVARVSARPMGVRLFLRNKVRSLRLPFVPWRDARFFSRYCNEQIDHGPRSRPSASPGSP
jgi:hypothetical protein